MTSRRAGIFLTRLFGAVAGIVMVLLPLPGGRAQDHDVDLALVLAIDCSFSVDSHEYRLQMEGIGRAFLRDEVKAAIRQGLRQRIAVTAVQWSDENNQKVILPWVIIEGSADADEVGMQLFSAPRALAQGGTSISTALLFSATLFDTAPSAERRVIDVSGDGRNNIGPPTAAARDKVVAKGVTINGLSILNEWDTLNIYFESHVVGGPGHFVIPAEDYKDFAEAMFRKLLREITGPGTT